MGRGLPVLGDSGLVWRREMCEVMLPRVTSLKFPSTEEANPSACSKLGAARGEGRGGSCCQLGVARGQGRNRENPSGI